MAKELLKGNIAMAEAAVRAGVEAYFGYPITPQTELLEHMSVRMPELGRVFLQAESEVRYPGDVIIIQPGGEPDDGRAVVHCGNGGARGVD